MDTEKKDKEPMDMASMQRVIKQLTNDIIDLKKNKGKGKKPFKSFVKKRTYFSPQIPPILGINIEDYAMENYCHTHHANHCERTCPKFINYFVAFLTPLRPPRREKIMKRRKKKKIKKRKKKEKTIHPT